MFKLLLYEAATKMLPICRHATISWGKSVFCPGKICINPYPSFYASICRENVHAIHIAIQFAKKSRNCVIKIDSQQQITKIGALLHVSRQSDYAYASDLLGQSCSTPTGDEISSFSRILQKELVESTIKLFCFATHYS